MKLKSYQALIIAKGLETYVSTGSNPGTSFTPAGMMKTASRLTGRTFQPHNYLEAAAALREWAAKREKREN